MVKPLDLSKRKFGRLTVSERQPNSLSGKTRWLCTCSCGTKVVVLAASLVSLKSTSCGCHKRDRLVSSNKSIIVAHDAIAGGNEMTCWRHMIFRCTDPSFKYYHRYGGRGITVCERWMGRDGFASFVSDMGRKPFPKAELDRIDNNGNYEPGNCRWTDRPTQLRNSSRNIMVTRNGKTMCLLDWCSELNLPYEMIRQRIVKLGWSHDEALNTSKQRSRHWRNL